MSKTQFEWQADEDEFLGRAPAPADKNRPVRRRWVLLAFIVIFVIAIGVTYWILDRRQRQMEEAVQQDVRVNFDLWQDALQQNDDELHDHLLATGDRLWRADQKRLFREDLLVGRSFLGLSTRELTSKVPKIELAPDWQQAIVSFEQTYSAPADVQTGEMVRLLHTAVFQKQDYRWLQTSPDEDFWGGWQTAENELLIVHYPARDAKLAQRISQQLEADLQAICAKSNDEDAGGSDDCRRFKPLILKMSTEVDALDALSSATGPLHIGSIFQLPAPTLVGVPLDESSYQAFYEGYSKKLIKEIRSVIGPPISLPDQVIRALCFNHPSVGPKLYKYDPSLGMWEAELPDHSFRFLESLPEDGGLILDMISDGRQSWSSRLIHWHEGSEKLLLEEGAGGPAYRLFNPADEPGLYLLLRRMADDQLTHLYRSLDLRSCDESGCDLGELPGYALWSPNGQQTLLQVGSDIYLGDTEGQILAPLGAGFNPFWLDDESIAHIRFVEREAGLTTELVLVQIAETGEQVLFDSNDLANAAGIEEGGLIIRYVAANPADPDLLLVHASGLHEFSGHYFIFTVRLPTAEADASDAAITLHLQREGSLGGESNVITPSGNPPFAISPDGRWLLVNELIGYDSATRTTLLHDMHRNQTKVMSDSDPVFPGQFPSYDWSDDGRWLVIAGDRFFRLIAPEYDYEQMAPHEFDYCVMTRWSD